MSSNLLAQFDSFYSAPQDKKNVLTPASNDLLTLVDLADNATHFQASTPSPAGEIWDTVDSSYTAQALSGQNDSWASFKAIETKTKTPTTTSSQTKNGASSTSGRARAAIHRRSTLDLFSGKGFDSAEQHEAISNPSTKLVGKSSSGVELLFDANDELDENDEFGEFETVSPPQVQPLPPIEDLFGAITLELESQKQPVSLLAASTNPNSNALPYPNAPKSPSFHERNPFSDLGVLTSPVSPNNHEMKPVSEPESPVTAWPVHEQRLPKSSSYRDPPAAGSTQYDEWGDFADFPANSPAKASSTIVEAEEWDWDTADQVADFDRPVVSAPPTNIPPPSMLLTLFPSLFDLPQSTLFKAISNHPFSLKNRIISDPSTIEFLRAYLHIATVAARIIAGRKLRWKRDHLLAQAMKIGPAVTGRKGGMKIASVDKSEITKEDREVADVVRVWKERLGRLRSAVVVANASILDASSRLIIPEINENLYVKAQEGALNAPKQCVVCGLKREERVNKVDFDVEDSFGEFWIEHWGHRACKNFWLEHETGLKHR